MAAAIRATLSPRVLDSNGQTIYRVGAGTRTPRSEVIDDLQAFIPVLSNSLLSMSGWPDEKAESYISKEGKRKEVTGWIADNVEYYGTYDLSASFRNMDGDPITALLAAWVIYAKAVYVGTMAPYPQYIVGRKIDYNTCIYRLVLDNTRTWVRKTYSVGASYPDGVPNGADGNFTSDSISVPDRGQVNTRFKAFGCRINDPITVVNFNRVVGMFNPMMRDSSRKMYMVKLNPSERVAFNYHGYPRISKINELEWWVTDTQYRRVYNSLGITLGKL